MDHGSPGGAGGGAGAGLVASVAARGQHHRAALVGGQVPQGSAGSDSGFITLERPNLFPPYQGWWTFEDGPEVSGITK